ncbi:MAG: hypothetical protein KGL39_14595 [Patescibacteria group bacterium]|nr:hypothetical protein [Patescibacteria group bacterium]
MGLFFDTETRSRVNIRAGLDAYFEGAEATLATYAFDDEPVELWEVAKSPMPARLRGALLDPAVVIVAHNAIFDRTVLRRLLHVETARYRWRCTRAQAYAHGLVGSLEGLARLLRLPERFQKLEEGKALIPMFCTPGSRGVYCTPESHPADWERFKQYAIRDTEAVRAIYRALPRINYSGDNLHYFALDMKINERGFAVDVPLIESAVAVLEDAKGESDAQVAHVTRGAVTAVTQRDKLLQYLTGKGVEIATLRKNEVEEALERDDLSPEDRFVLQARLEGARASGAKYKRALSMKGADDRLRFTMQFSGAGRTGRTAHKGFQPGNMPRATIYNPNAATLAERHVPVKAKFIDAVVVPAIRDRSILRQPWLVGSVNAACAIALRHAIVASPGNILVCADYKNIESRVTAWYAGEDWRLLAYAAQDRGEGEDLYKMLYSKFFGAPMDRINDHERNAGKVVTLACDFGGSVGAVVTMAAGYGMDLSILPPLVMPNATDRQRAKAETVWRRAFLAGEDYGLEPAVFQAAHVLVQTYRAANPRVDEFKQQVGRAVTNAVNTPHTLFSVGRLNIWSDGAALIVELPSKYRLIYWSPRVQTERVLDVETGELEDRAYLTFLRARGSQMLRVRGWPGLFVENVAQATANQFLRFGSICVEREFPDAQVLSVHDEILCDVPKGSMSVKDLIRLMTTVPEWGRGMPLAAEGWENERYGKR